MLGLFGVLVFGFTNCQGSGFQLQEFSLESSSLGLGSGPGIGSTVAITDLSAVPSHVEAGQKTTITWNVTGAKTVLLLPDNTTLDLGGSSSVQVQPNETTTYTLQASNDQETVSRPITVYVNKKGTKTAYTTSPLNSSFAVVYIRVPKTPAGPYGNGTSGPQGHFDVVPEVTVQYRGLTGPGQLVYRDRLGNEKVLFDCINQKATMPDGTSSSCLPMDPTVSFDGKKVIFTVLYADFAPYKYYTFSFSNISNNEKGAQIHEVDIATGAVRKFPFQAGDFDTAPVYLPDGNVMFTSSRAHEYTSSAHFCSTPIGPRYASPILQLYIAGADGSNIHRVGQHNRDGVLHPFVMSDGRVLFSTWSTNHMNLFRKNNGSAGGCSTVTNEFWLASVDSTGGDFKAVFGKHSKEWISDKGIRTSTAFHFLTETPNGFLCTGDYYRGNNMGGGEIECFEREANGVEGPAPGEVDNPMMVFVPRNLFSAFTFSSGGDFPSSVGANGLYQGSLRDPMALPGNQLLFTYNNGACERNISSIESYINQTPVMDCDMGIYMTTKIPASRGDMVKVVDSPNYHEYMARVAEPYSFIYGKEKPGVPAAPRLTGTEKPRCLIGSSSMEAEVEPATPYTFNGVGQSSHDCAVQGCKARAIGLEKVKAIRFWEVIPNTAENLNGALFLLSTTGNRHRLLGDVPLQADGSWVAEIPCDTPYVMAGVTQDGEVIMRDQVPQSLRPGEVRTCVGCHLHSGREGRPFDQSLAFNQLSGKLKDPGNQMIVPKVGVDQIYPEIIKGKIVNQPQGILYEYTQHIAPILSAPNANGVSCVSCHNQSSAAGGLRLDYTETFAYPGNNFEQYKPNRTWYEIVAHLPQGWERPYSSKYVNMAFALESLFYWKAAGRRMDGRTDSTYNFDVDFGTQPHSYLNDDQVRIIKNWLDSGAYYKN